MRHLLIIAACALAIGCSGTQSLDVDWSRAIQLSGDLRCEGEGRMRILDLIEMGAEGRAAAGADVDAGDACAGLTLYLGQWRWSWTSAVQEPGPCEAIAGKLKIEIVELPEP